MKDKQLAHSVIYGFRLRGYIRDDGGFELELADQFETTYATLSQRQLKSLIRGLQTFLVEEEK